MSALKIIFYYLRSLLFYPGFITVIVATSLLTCALCFLPFAMLQKVATSGNYLVMLWLRITCGVKIKVSGVDNLPAGPCVILSNHQSSWEAFFMQWYFQPANFILKRELLWIPLFGWALHFMQPIPIQRAEPAKAIRSVLKEGTRRLQRGNRVVIYPEGTRTNKDQLGEFKTSGAALAKRAKVPVIAVAHNSGEHWQRKGLLKIPGTIHMQIGPVIDSSQLSARDITDHARNWIASRID
ncbi:MAG: lysophospholipid acyltransferase family protein [Porticoccaceae bacterium]